LYVQLARALGAAVIAATDINNFRLDMAKQLGADYTFSAKDNVPEKFKEINDGYPVDIVVLCTGAAPAVKQALESVERNGTVLFFAATGPGVEIPFSVNDVFWRKDVTLTTSYAASPDDYQQALELVGKGIIDTDRMTTHVLPMKEVARGFKLVAEAAESIKVIIEPQK